MQRLPAPIGATFDRLTILEELPDIKKIRVVRCRCSCGTEKAIRLVSVTTGKTSSCGCYHRETVVSQKNRLTHGKAGTQIYIAWKAILRRCRDSKLPRYGGRGITFDPRWESFGEFYKDMVESYEECLKTEGSQQTSIDRIDNNGNYCKENCRWTNRKQQQLNRSSANLITHNNETLNLKTWSERTGIKVTTLSERLRRGWSIEKVLTHPIEVHIRKGESNENIAAS